MGGRGASSGMSISGKKYGTEYTTLHTSGNIKFIKYNDSSAAKSPMETMTKGRVYVTVNNHNELRSVTYYDKHNKRFKQIDINGKKHNVNGERVIPHTHRGYIHDEKGTYFLSKSEVRMVDRVRRIWYHAQGRL